LHGTGANGKTTFTEAIRHTLGDYARATPFSTFESGNRDEKRVDLAALRGVRFVSASEAEDGRRLAEARVKAVTGGDVISCRRLYGDFFEYRPSFKIWLATNYKPEIRGTDLGIWRRLRLIPFTRQFTGDAADVTLLDQLNTEAPGILAWAVQGCLQWQQDGLGNPAAVQVATAEYRAEQDVLGAFLDECTEARPDASVSVRAGELFERYRRWADANGEFPGSNKRFSETLANRGFARANTSKARGFRGLALRQAQPQTSPMEF
jgi:P4 family phage/plasmid primase-like protien